jgi:hypothetical protein
MIDDDFWSNWWNENWQGKPKYSEKTYPSATLSTKSHMTDPVSFPALNGGVSHAATPIGPRACLDVIAKEMNSTSDGHQTSVV